MNLNNLYDLAEKENIHIYDYYIDNAYGAFVNIDNINTIVLNYKEIIHRSKEKETLAEELGHYYYDATYPLDCNNINYISKQEYRAKKWSYNVLIPFEKLKLAIKNRN